MLLTTGNGIFAAKVDYNTGTGPSSVAAALRICSHSAGVAAHSRSP